MVLDTQQMGCGVHRPLHLVSSLRTKRAMPPLPLRACTACYGQSFAFNFIPAIYHITVKTRVHIQNGGSAVFNDILIP
jgi:hypothetical protein